MGMEAWVCVVISLVMELHSLVAHWLINFIRTNAGGRLQVDAPGGGVDAGGACVGVDAFVYRCLT